MKAQFRAQQAPWMSGVEILIADPEFKTRVVNIELKKLDDAVRPEPSFTLDMTQAQVLMDDLWACGVRPTEGAGTAGSMRAVEKHLEDMRTLVFAALTVTKP